jgi:uncharacterized protein
MWTIVLLVISNIFMTFAWYGHLKFPKWPLWIVVMASWGIALAEYCFQVPANRLGQEWYHMSAAQMKIIQEVITLIVFGVFSFTYLGQPLKWNHYVAFLLVLGAVFFMFVQGGPDVGSH